MNGMSTVVKTVARWVIGFILLVGLWLVAYGHLSPGGGFPGGVVIASGFILLVLAHGGRSADRVFPRPVARVLDSVGALSFLFLALLGLWVGGEFFRNTIQKGSPGRLHEDFNAGIIPFANLAIAVKVSMSFVVAFGVIAACRLRAGGAFESEEED